MTIVAAILLVPFAWIFGRWPERVCAALVVLPASLALAELEAVRAATAFEPSLLLKSGFDLACLLGMLRVAFSADRWFPLVMAAAALVGLVARLLEFSPWSGSHLHLLQMPSAPLTVMILTLAAAVGVSLSRRHRPTLA